MIETLSREFKNEEALTSPIYNPTISQETATLFAMMEPPSEEVIEQYREIVLTMPTSNPYVGVISNPQSCEISEVKTDIQQVRLYLTEIYDLVQQTGSGPDIYAWQVAMPGLTADVDVAEDSMVEMQDHTDRLVANLPTVVGMAQSETGIQNGMATVASLGGGLAGGVGALLGAASSITALLGPCLPVQGFLGSLMERGTAMLNQAKEFVNALKDNLLSAINEIKDGIMGTVNSIFSGLQDVLGSVQSVMNQVMGVISNIKSMIQEEIGNLVNGLLNMARMSLADLMARLKLDPCLSGLLNGLSGGRIGGALGL